MPPLSGCLPVGVGLVRRGIKLKDGLGGGGEASCGRLGMGRQPFCSGGDKGYLIWEGGPRVERYFHVEEGDIRGCKEKKLLTGLGTRSGMK